MERKLFDCIVVGAGPAGLSASVFLARYRHSVLAFDHSSPRNKYAHGIHGFLGHDDIAPAELLARGRAEAMKYGGTIVKGCVTSAERVSDHFRISVKQDGLQSQSFDARRLLLASGLRDLTPNCPGFREFYGISVHHCPDCDGYESTNKRLAVLGSGTKTVGFALGLLTWTDKITLITDGKGNELTSDGREKLASLQVGILDKRVTRLEGDENSGQLHRVIFDDGSALECEALFFNLGTEHASDLHADLACKLDEDCGLVWVDETQQTSVPGVYAAGDITPNSQLAIVAAAEGAMAAVHIHQSLIPSERKVN